MPPWLIVAVAAAGAAWLFGSSTAPEARRPKGGRRPRVFNRQAGLDDEAQVALYAVQQFIQIYRHATPPDVEFVRGADAHYDWTTHRVRIDLVWVRRMMRQFCADHVCAVHVIVVVVAHEMRHSMQVHSAFDTLATRRAHEDDADFAIGVVMAHLNLDPGEVEHVMRHLGGPGGTEHSPGHRRAASVWNGYRAARGN